MVVSTYIYALVLLIMDSCTSVTRYNGVNMITLSHVAVVYHM